MTNETIFSGVAYVYVEFQEDRESVWGVWRNNVLKFSKFDENSESTDPRSSMNPKKNTHIGTFTPKHRHTHIHNQTKPQHK